MNAETSELLERMLALADEIEEPYVCREPAYGAPGHAHCAACCYNTGFITTCDEDQAMVDAAKGLRRAVFAVRHGLAAAGSVSSENPPPR